MPLIRAIVIDDSAFVRKVVREMLEASPAIEVVGAGRNGVEGLQLVQDLKPDAVICDLTMPEMNGVEFVREQMKRRPLPIVILSASPDDGPEVLEALEAGAFDFIRKPTARATNELLVLRRELIEKIKEAGSVPARAQLETAETTPAAEPAVEAAPAPAKIDIVVLGISTGGPQALRRMVPMFSAKFPVPLAIVLHMPVGYTALFAEKLGEISRLKVKEASDGCPLVAGEALIAQAGRHLTFRRGATGEVRGHLTVQPTGKPHRPSVDVMFESAAKVYGGRVLGVVMTGMGNDGTEGAGWIKAQGGMILTEAEPSCIVYGMPRAVVEAGLSDGAVMLDSMAGEIKKRL